MRPNNSGTRGLISDENVQGAVKSYICDTGYVKGSPNLTLMDVVSWVKTNYDVEVSKSSVGHWLHQLGFTYVQHTKGVYFDGHERTDVVASRKAYLETLSTHDKRSWQYYSPCPNPAKSPISSGCTMMSPPITPMPTSHSTGQTAHTKF